MIHVQEILLQQPCSICGLLFTGHREIHIWTAKLILCDFLDTTTVDVISEILQHSATYPEHPHPVTPPRNPGTSWWFPSDRWDEICTKKGNPGPGDTEHRERVGRCIGDPSKWCKWVKGVWGTWNTPKCSMYGIFTYIWLKFMVHVDNCSIHGAYGTFKHLEASCHVFRMSVHSQVTKTRMITVVFRGCLFNRHFPTANLSSSNYGLNHPFVLRVENMYPPLPKLHDQIATCTHLYTVFLGWTSLSPSWGLHQPILFANSSRFLKRF